MGIFSKLELENEHIAEEMVEHLVLEKIGGLPDHGHAKGIRLKKRVNRRVKKNYDFEFYLIFTIIIFGELWYIWMLLAEKYPQLESFSLF